MGITLDRSAAPLLIVTATGDLALEDLQRYHAELEPLLNGKQKIAMVVSVVGMGKFDRRILSAQSEWFKAHRAVIKDQWLGIVFHLGSPIVRFLLSSFLLIGGFPMAYAAKEDRDAAFAWASDILSKHGLTHPTPRP